MQTEIRPSAKPPLPLPQSTKSGIYKRYIKRLIDIIISLVAIIVLSPVLLAVALLVKIKLGSPVLFKQKRPGLNEKIFTLYKFRTMTDEHAKTGKLLADDLRLTSFGKFLRSTSLDELPELWNILKGDMSFVGPRPLLIEYLKLYTPEQNQRHNVRPGVTGWAQINGRNAINWEEKFEHDLWYIKNQSLWLDFKILIHTATKVLKREGINAAGEATMPKFRGNAQM